MLCRPQDVLAMLIGYQCLMGPRSRLPVPGTVVDHFPQVYQLMMWSGGSRGEVSE